jgi:MFS family permease
LLLGIALLMLGAGLQTTLLGVRATLEGFATFVTALVMACYYVGMVAGSIAAPAFVHRVGHVRVFAGVTSIASAAVLLHSLFVHPWSWALLRAASGFSFACIYVVAESWLNGHADNRTRGGLLSLYMVVLYLGLGFGQFLMNLGEPDGSLLFIVVAVLISAAVVPMAFTTHTAPEFRFPQRAPVRELARLSPLGIAGVVFSGATTGTVFSLGAVYAAGEGLATSRIAVFMACGIFAAVVMQLPLGRLSDRIDRRSVLAAMSGFAAAAAIAALVVVHVSMPLFFAAAALCAGLSMSTYSLAIAHVNDHLPPAQIVAASGTLILVNGAGAVLAPMIVGAAMQWTANGAYFVGLAAMHSCFAAYALWRKAHRAPVPAAEKVSFVVAQPQASTTAIAADVAARAHADGASHRDDDLTAA